MSNRTIEGGSNCRNRSRNGIVMERHRKHRLSMAQGESTSCYGVTRTPTHDSAWNRSASRTLSLGTGAAAPSQWHPPTRPASTVVEGGCHWRGEAEPVLRDRVRYVVKVRVESDQRIRVDVKETVEERKGHGAESKTGPAFPRAGASPW